MLASLALEALILVDNYETFGPEIIAVSVPSALSGWVHRYGISAAFYPLRPSDPEHLYLERVAERIRLVAAFD